MTYQEESEKETAEFIKYIESQNGDTHDRNTNDSETYRGGNKAIK